jgi:hypothetical protein
MRLKHLRHSKGRSPRAVLETLEHRRYFSTAASVASLRGLDHWWMDWSSGTAQTQLAETNAGATTPVGSTTPTPPTPTAPAPPVTPVPPVVPVAPSATPLLPTAPSYSTPASNPTLPSGMNLFTPAFGTQTSSSGSPIIADASASAGPNDTITLTGTQLTADSGSNAYSDTSFYVYGQTGSGDAATTPGQIQDVTSTGAEVTIDPSEPANSMYMVWATNAEGASAPVFVNQTQAWWMGAAGESVDTSTTSPTIDSSSGQTMSVFGQNLSNGASAPQSWVYLQPTGGGAGIWATVNAVNPYKVDFTVPTVSATTTYQVWINNGLGGNYGWSEVTQNGTPVVLSVAATAPAWSTAAADTFNVVSYGADNTGATDAGAAIQSAVSALEAASNAAGKPQYTYTLYLPAGTYLIDEGEKISIPSNVRVLGAGEGDTTLEFEGAVSYPAASTPFDALSLYGDSNVAIDSITIEHTGATVTTGIPSAWNGANTLVDLENSTNVTLNDVNIISNESGPTFQGATAVTIENCDIDTDINALWTRDLFMNNCNLYLANDAEEAIVLGGSANVSLTNTSVGNLDDSITDSWAGAGQSRFIEYNTDFGTITNQYIAGNTTLLGQPFPGNSGEQILCEGGSAVAFTGSPTSVTANTMTFTVSAATESAADLNYNGQDVVVTDGVGLAQFRTVQSTGNDYDASTSTDTVTITLNENWNVQPNTASYFMIGNIMSNAVIYQNTLQDEVGTAGIGANAQASTGVAVEGYGIVVDGNTMKDLGEGVRLSGQGGNDSPDFFEEVVNNQISLSPTDTGPYAILPTGVAIGGALAGDAAHTNFVGVVVRNNAISGTQVGITMAWQGWGSDTLTVVEDNNVAAQTGVVVFDDPSTLIRDNTFTSSASFSTPPAAVLFSQDSQDNAPTALMQGNIYDGFASADVYSTRSAAVPTAILAAPYDTLSATVSAGDTVDVSLPLWDDSPTSLTWAGTTGAAWLSFNTSNNGSISNEDSTSTPTLVANAAGLSAGTYLSTVTVTDGAQSKIFTFALDVT